MENDRLMVVLAEFGAMRNEINLKLQMRYQIYTIYFTALGLFYGYVVLQNKFTCIIVVPLFAAPLFLMVFYDKLMIGIIAKYIKEEISEKQIPAIIAPNPDKINDNSTKILQMDKPNIQFWNWHLDVKKNNM
jgi:hypothetical protein